MTDDEAYEHNGIDEIESESLRLEALKIIKKETEAEIADIEKYLDKALEKEHRFEDDGSIVSVTVVRGHVDRFDDHLISTRYPYIWNTVTRRVIDKDMYKDAVRAGIITTELHNRFHHEVPRKSYVLVSRIKQEDK